MTDRVGQEAPPSAHQIFGDRIELAEKYWFWLAGEAVVRGLIGPRESERLWDRHILNCAVVGECLVAGESVVDVGSGAGLPGIPLAIARPDVTMTLVEPLLRRATFLQEVVDDLGIDVHVVRGRAEERTVMDAVGGADVVTSRAVAPLDRLIKWSGPLIATGGRLVALKGSSAEDEILTHRAAAGNFGIAELHVRSCGAEILDLPTLVVEGRKTGGSKAARRASKGSPKKRRAEGS